MVIGFSGDKNLDEILDLLPRDAHYIFTQADSPRALPAEELFARAVDHGLGGDLVASVPAALAAARALSMPEDMVFVGGSVFVVSEVV